MSPKIAGATARAAWSMIAAVAASALAAGSCAAPTKEPTHPQVVEPAPPPPPESTAPAAPAAPAAEPGDLPAPPDVAAPPAGALTSPRGVFYKVLVAGKGGPKPTADDTVRVHYTGWTTNGKMFDSSRTRGEPGEFPLRYLIPGWTDAIPVMSVGDQVRFWIPEALAYAGKPGMPQGMLVFDVELLAILTPPP